MEDDLGIGVKLALLAFNIKNDTYFIVMLLKKEIKAHNILSLMFNLKFKSLCLVFSFIGYVVKVFLLFRHIIRNFDLLCF
jgi:hypothetical protein